MDRVKELEKIEQLAADYANKIDAIDPKDNLSWHQLRAAFLAGYEAGQENSTLKIKAN